MLFLRTIFHFPKKTATHNKKEKFKLYSPEYDLPAPLKRFHPSFLTNVLEVEAALVLVEFYVFTLAEVCKIQIIIIKVQTFK